MYLPLWTTFLVAMHDDIKNTSIATMVKCDISLDMNLGLVTFNRYGKMYKNVKMLKFVGGGGCKNFYFYGRGEEV